jgi:hypothetical protein
VEGILVHNASYILSIYERRWFVCFVCQVEISQTTTLLAALFGTLGKPSMSSREACTKYFIMFRPALEKRRYP